ncbi:PH domain-containing protein [Macrococcus capreoli]|uniref:PH domain-containing protein n=1 Tax=Macrococcus capreoli TaxID=2982690 RepID=UPI0021D60034|nr:PH domain-containing protein [Macrococcus sp. TMW 2.2395]MCU7558080.1 PH domain-containing protein [Macrococcus sp. TMW 2.2395]
MKKMHKDSMKLMKIGACIDLLVALIILIIIIVIDYMDWIPVHPYIYYGFIILGLLNFILDFFYFTKLKYQYSLFGLLEDEIITENGILNKQKNIVPYATVQNVETEQGPIMKRFNIKSLQVKTAENAISIPFVHETEAEQLKAFINQKMRAAEQRRIHD